MTADNLKGDLRSFELFHRSAKVTSHSVTDKNRTLQVSSGYAGTMVIRGSL